MILLSFVIFTLFITYYSVIWSFWVQIYIIFLLVFLFLVTSSNFYGHVTNVTSIWSLSMTEDIFVKFYANWLFLKLNGWGILISFFSLVWIGLPKILAQIQGPASIFNIEVDKVSTFVKDDRSFFCLGRGSISPWIPQSLHPM